MFSFVQPSSEAIEQYRKGLQKEETLIIRSAPLPSPPPSSNDLKAQSFAFNLFPSFDNHPYTKTTAIKVDHLDETSILDEKPVTSTIRIVDLGTKTAPQGKIEKLLVLDCDEVLAKLDELAALKQKLRAKGLPCPSETMDPELIFPEETKAVLSKAVAAGNVKIIVMTARNFNDETGSRKHPTAVINILKRIGPFFENIYFVGSKLPKAIVIDWLHKNLFNTNEADHTLRTLLVDDTAKQYEPTAQLGYQVARVNTPPTKSHLFDLHNFIMLPAKTSIKSFSPTAPVIQPHSP